MTDFVRLGDIASSSYGLTASAKTDPTGHRFLRITDIVNGVPGSYESVPFVDVDESSATKYTLNRGDIVIARTGATVGATHWFRGWREPVLYASYLVRFIPEPTIADSRFVGYALQSPAWTQYVYANAFAKSAQPNMSAGVMSEYRFRLPPIQEQKRVGRLLGSLDDKIAANREIQRLTDEIIQSLWRKLINEDSGFVELGDVVHLNPRTTAPKGSTLTTIEMKNLPESGFSVDTWADREAKGGSRYRNGDTLLARITPCFENGKCGYVDFLEPDEVGAGSTEFIVLRPQAGVPSAAPYAIARSPEFRTFAAQTMTGTSGRQRVQTRDLESHEIAWPSENLIADFEAKTSPLLDLAGKLRDENLTLAKTRDELLPLLMSGKITVKEAEQEATAAGAVFASEENEA